MEAKNYDEIEKNLIKIFKEQQKRDDHNIELKIKSFEPLTKAINKVEEKIGDVIDQNINLMNLVPVVNKFADTSIPESVYSEENILPSSTPFRAINQKKVIEDSTFIDPNIVSPKTLNRIIGPIAQKYLPRAKDDKFGLYWNKNKNHL